MGYQPLPAVRGCPACGKQPAVRFKHFFSTTVRLECQCGVAGQWRTWTHDQPDPWNDAAGGWSLPFGLLSPGPPPGPPRR